MEEVFSALLYLFLLFLSCSIYTTCYISGVIIQQIVTLSKYGHDALDICHP